MIIKRERISDVGLHENTDLVELETRCLTARNGLLVIKYGQETSLRTPWRGWPGIHVFFCLDREVGSS